MTIKRRVVVLRFACGLRAGELRAARALLEEAAALGAVTENMESVHALRGVSVADNMVELTVALGGYGNVADGVQRTIELVDELLSPSHRSELSLASVKVRKT